MSFKNFFSFALLAVSSLLSLACSVNGDAFYSSAMGLNRGTILVATVNGTTSYTITKYSIDGKFQQLLLDTSVTGFVPRGMAFLDPLHALVSMDGVDSLLSLNIMNGKTDIYHQSAMLNGSIFGVARQGQSTYVVETNNIERIDGGNRYPATGNAYIPVTVGGCTISGARSVAFNRLGHLLVSSNTNSRLLLYDVRGATPSCLVSDGSFGAVRPAALLAHSNGKVYFGTTTDNAIYVGPDDLSSGAQVLTSTGITAPSALAEMPDGSILVANDGTVDTIIRIDPKTGAVLDGNFIKNSFTIAVSAILVVPPL